MNGRRHLGRLVAAVGVIAGGGIADAAHADLFVYSGAQSQILRFEVTGAPLGTFANVGGPFVLAFGGLTPVAVPALPPAGLVVLALLIAAVALRLLRAF